MICLPCLDPNEILYILEVSSSNIEGFEVNESHFCVHFQNSNPLTYYLGDVSVARATCISVALQNLIREHRISPVTLAFIFQNLPENNPYGFYKVYKHGAGVYRIMLKTEANLLDQCENVLLNLETLTL